MNGHTNSTNDLESGGSKATARITKSRKSGFPSLPNDTKYDWFNRLLRFDHDENGDIYDRHRLRQKRAEWFIDNSTTPEKMPYLEHVRKLESAWQSLELLVDFMEIGTSPERWKKALKSQVDIDRICRTKVTRLDYHDSEVSAPMEYLNIESLRGGLKDKAAEKGCFRLYVVEDLSRDVIEALGSKFDIEPHFFREHIFDYAWYNTRDRWAYRPRFRKLVREQRWFQIRFNTSRYFRSSKSFQAARQEAENFNVFRRPDDDTNNRAIWDQEGAIVGITRTRASFWLGDVEDGKGKVGILLVDPTIKEGHPLWYGYGNWEKTPRIGDATNLSSTPPPRDTLFKDIIYWAQRPPSLGISEPNSANLPQVPVLAILHLVASEWLTMADYIKTRLGQIEWEVSYPEHFLNKENTIDVPLKKLHIWRRLVPLYREMLSETLHGVFKFPPRSMGLATTPKPKSADANCDVGKQILLSDPMGDMQQEFARALSYMEEYQGRIDRLTSVVTAVISIDDSRHSQEDNRNVARLTWLATFFIPLSFVASLFSMTDNIHVLGNTYKWFAIIGLVLSMISLGLGVVLTMPRVTKLRRKFTNKWKASLKARVKTWFKNRKED